MQREDQAAKSVLITGGAGFIGSFTAALLIQRGFKVFVADNLSTGHREALPPGTSGFELLDICDSSALGRYLAHNNIHSIIHFAAKSLVAESVRNPLLYYRNNTAGTLNLIEAAAANGVKNIIFSSTAAVYGNPQGELFEDHPLKPLNPYGHSKLAVEYMLRDACKSSGLKAVCLRYFNAAGAAPDGMMGEDHNPETHLIPLVVGAAFGIREELSVFGDDYETHDGSAVRDYINVNDLAEAHLLALKRCYAAPAGYFDIFNVGTGEGNSVFEVIQTCQEVLDCDVPYRIAARREGDPAVLVAGVKKIISELGFKPRYSLADSIRQCALFTERFPLGYRRIMPNVQPDAAI